MTPYDGKTVLSCRNVSKSYGSRQILKDIGMEMCEGAVLGLLGPNGAGKTSFMKSILGLVYPDAGEISVFGHDISSKREQALEKVGAIVEAPVFPGYLTAYENLKYLSSLTCRIPKTKIMDTLELVGLKDVADRKVESFSFGMKQRLGIAQSLLPDSKFLILDEPTNGLDPHGIAGMRKLLRRLSEELKVSIMVSSHLLHEIEHICTHIVIIHHGAKILDASAAELSRMNETVAVTVRKIHSPLLREFQGFLSEQVLEDDEEFSILKYSIAPGQIPELVKKSVESGAEVYAVNHHKMNLEDIFIDMTSSGEKNACIDSF
ncbi:MAG: hypothetical protein A2X49_01095 [Lentisphaerae bacterium GWF2_52_8]|nr:MAG: hypothetical protein A2X49_01095 [Lentisphaerae bacterium GWF2_52_8]